jgi:hypothetical protein
MIPPAVLYGPAMLGPTNRRAVFSVRRKHATIVQPGIVRPWSESRRSRVCTIEGVMAWLHTGTIAAALVGAALTSSNAIAETTRLASAFSSDCSDISCQEGSVNEASSRFAIPGHWIRAVMRIESGGRVHATSPRGALGLMQIMPKTWSELRNRYGLGFDPFDPHDNIIAGTAYLREMLDRFGLQGFLAAYNAGPRRYQAYLADGQPLPVETQRYVAKLAELIAIEQDPRLVTAAKRVSAWRNAPLFVEAFAGSSAALRRVAAERLTGGAGAWSATLDAGFVPHRAGLFALREGAHVQCRDRLSDASC